MLEQGTSFQHEFAVSESVYQGFLAVFNDRNPLHTDEAFAQQKGFRSVVMHGNILNGFLSYFIGECLPTKDVVIHKQEIKFHRPVYMGDRVTLEAKIDEVSEALGVRAFKFKFYNQEREMVAVGRIQIGLLA